MATNGQVSKKFYDLKWSQKDACRDENLSSRLCVSVVVLLFLEDGKILGK